VALIGGETMGYRKLDLVTARAVHLAMASTFQTEPAARELVDLSGGSWAVLSAALLRVERALDDRWSIVAERAADALRVAVAASAAQSVPVAS
jgi:hypothetical protein